MELSRRKFMQGVGALGGAAAASAFSFPTIADAAKNAKNGSAAEAAVEIRKVKSGCAICPNFCGIEATVVNGIIRTIYPDTARAEFYNHGICPKGASGMFNTYDPYRLKKPLRRTNPKKGPGEDPRWVEISWDEAFNTIAERLKKLRAEDPRKLIWQHGQGKYLIQEQYCQAWTKAFGTPNMVHRTTACEAARHVADELTWAGGGILPDLKYSKLLLNFGANYYEGEQTSRWLDWQTMQSIESNGLKTIVVEPRLSGVAGKAHEWVPVRPGKDVVMILAMAKVMIDAGTIDEPFLVDFTNAPQLVDASGTILKDKDGKTPLVWDTVSGSAKPYLQGVKPALKGAYNVDGKPCRTAFQVLADSIADITPEYAQEVADVPAATITRLAQTFAKEARIGETIVIDGQTLRYRPAVLYSFRGLAAKEHGVQGWRTGLILNMLVGNIDAVGGLMLGGAYGRPQYFDVSKCEYPPSRADLAQSVFFPYSNHHIAQTPNLVVQDPQAYGLAYQPEMQIFYGTNRPVSIPNSWQQFAGLAKTYNVVIDIVMSESAWYADIVLPDKTYLESWHFAPTRGTTDTGHIAIRQPMANPYNLQHDAFSIMWELSKRVGFRDQFAEQCNKSWGLKEVTFKPGRDYTTREGVEILWADKAKKDFSVAIEQGFVGSRKSVKSKYLSGAEDKFKGPGKAKMKFYADQLIDTYYKAEGIVKKNSLASFELAKLRIAYAPLPTRDHAFPTPHREAKDYPFYVITHKRMYRNQSGNTVNNVILNQAIGKDAATNFVQINAATAGKLGIKGGDAVMIETRVGKIKGTAQVIQGIRPDTIAVSYHYGQWSPGYAPDAHNGTAINQVLEHHPDLISGHNSFNDTKCKLYKA
ncbi:MAG TPA: molybdopterin-dependent oxidoreductase [Noviherbaspirillum sp.]|uniref:molybdopterin-containing oxidoreductase family protein n=1 Tax=Noviherbaspirillum sp. TaxID=1926288 RepID=UPI002B45EDBA|nr:molybdopterin-dependent oxidoreductase [Noviherbaspirillum sp.]HJV88386.1 molybdopterin-dependent oxidoreductase [Noviherbaspirillum sp.]